MIFAVFDPLPLTVCINGSFLDLLKLTDICRRCRSLFISELINISDVLLELIGVCDGAFYFPCVGVCV